MSDRFQSIRNALAMGPTPGPWDGIQYEGSRWTEICQIRHRYAMPIAFVPPYSVLDENRIWKERKDETIANAKHVAACDPDTIRELIRQRDELLRLVHDYRGIAEFLARRDAAAGNDEGARLMRLTCSRLDNVIRRAEAGDGEAR